MKLRTSAGILLYRKVNDLLQVFIVHPGGPAWSHKDLGVWSIPKGEVEGEADIQATALREFEEETGFPINFSTPIDLGTIIQKSGKVVYAWAVEDKHNVDPKAMKCNTIEIEWPPQTGQVIMIPEVDRGEFVDTQTAKQKLLSAQAVFIDRLLEKGI